MKRLIAISVLCAAASVCAMAQDASVVAMVFDALPREARTLSMGGVSAVSNTSMRLFDAQSLDIQANYCSWAPKSAKTSDINATVFAKAGDKFGIDVAFSTCSGASYTVVGESGISGKEFSPKDMLVKAGVGYMINDMLSVSAAFRYMSSTLAPGASYSAMGGDLFVSGDFDGFKATAGINSIGTKVKTDGGAEFPIPTAITLAGEYPLAVADNQALSFAAQADYYLNGGIRLGLGAEYAFNDMVFARLGYSLGGKSVIPSFLSAGVISPGPQRYSPSIVFR